MPLPSGKVSPPPRRVDAVITDVRGTVAGNPDLPEEEARDILETLASTGVRVYVVTGDPGQCPPWLQRIADLVLGKDSGRVQEVVRALAENDALTAIWDDDDHWPYTLERLGKQLGARLFVVPSCNIPKWWGAYQAGSEEAVS